MLYPDDEKKLENILHRLKRYLDLKGISIASFERNIGMANASIGKSMKTGGTFGADKLEIILRKYPDINLNWLVFGEGNMTTSQEPHRSVVSIAEEPVVKYGDNSMIKIAQLQEQIIELQAQRIKDVEVIARLKSELDQCRSKFSHSALTPTTGL